MLTRILPFTSINNFRDYGGYAVAGGGRLREGLLFRSAQHMGASAEDLERLGKIGMVTVIDLRGDKERLVAPCPRPEGFSARIVMVNDETAGLAPHIEAARQVNDPDSAAAAMRAGYAEMPFRPKLVEVMSGYFQALAGEDGPSLIHCMAGKDRTGIAVALFHKAMGVHHDDMMADYMLTNQAGNIEQRIAAGAITVRKAFGAHLDDPSVRALMTVEPSYLESAFAEIAVRHGSTDAYLEEILGVTPAVRARLTASLII